jgi:hypothetical protein
MERLTYISTAEFDLTRCQLDALLRSAAEKNAQHSVTGCLLYNGVNFLQTIEGEVDDLGVVLARIQASKKHSGISIISHERQIDRAFAGWSMHRIEPATALPDDVPDHLKQVYRNFLSLAGMN